jgi:hypothetical protein
MESSVYVGENEVLKPSPPAPLSRKRLEGEIGTWQLFRLRERGQEWI